ncbi:MAG: hypothetical protein LBD64_00930, partial [Odoribacteraceae bacterium]|nr:hypothetical protein [Odoribacteraceae bacterium]
MSISLYFKFIPASAKGIPRRDTCQNDSNTGTRDDDAPGDEACLPRRVPLPSPANAAGRLPHEEAGPRLLAPSRSLVIQESFNLH